MQTDVDDYLEFLTHVRRYSPHTVANYQRDLLQLHDYLLRKEHKGISDLSKLDHIALRGFLAERHKKDKNATVLRKLSSIRTFLKWATKEGRIKASPADLMDNPKRRHSLPRSVSVDEAFALCDAPSAETAVGLRDRAVIELLYASGIRISELVNLDINDVDFKGGTIRVLGKGNKERVVPFHDVCAKVIEAWLDQGRPPVGQRGFTGCTISGRQRFSLGRPHRASATHPLRDRSRRSRQGASS